MEKIDLSPISTQDLKSRAEDISKRLEEILESISPYMRDYGIFREEASLIVNELIKRGVIQTQSGSAGI